MNYLRIAALLYSILIAEHLHAQVAENSSLFQEIMQMDNRLFEQGFNQCKLETLDQILAPDLDFVHDLGGQQNRAEFLQAMQRNVCANPEGKPVRTLITGSTKVFPLHKDGVLYGAIQTGIHQFHLAGEEHAKEIPTRAKFTSVWIRREGKWLLKNALSYDHQKTPQTSDVESAAKATSIQTEPFFQIRIGKLSFVLDFSLPTF